jgi:putative hemolysin
MARKKLEKIVVPEEEKLINVEKAIRDKNPKLLKWMPGFLLRYIKRILHEDDLNNLFYRTKNSTTQEFLDIGMNEMGPIVTVEGLENLPTEGGIYLTANHPLGGLDGAALIQICMERRTDLKFFVNDILMQVKTMKDIFVPVNKHGRNDKRNKEAFEAVYQSENCLIIFPAGLVSRRQKGGVIMDLQWKKSIIQKSIQYDKPIIPVHIDALNSKKFYNLAYWRKKLGIKANIEMFFLADEMYKQDGKKIHLTFGKPIPASQFTEDKRPEEWVQWLKEKVYSLAPKPKG